jgi:hypothetical protein
MINPSNNEKSWQNAPAPQVRMTIAEFRKKHPGCKIGYPSPSFPLIAMLVCAALLTMLLSYLLHLVRDFRSIEGLNEIIAGFGAICLSFSLSVGVYATGLRLGEVIGWFRSGRNMFAVAEDEAIIVDEKGESVVFPIAGVTKLDWYQHRLEIKLKANDPIEAALYLILIRVFPPGGDGANSTAFFKALEPRVKKLAPQAEVSYQEIKLFG